MNEKKLQAFLTVLRCGSISKAAEHLDYTQPALTQMMNKLEQDLDCKLLARNYQGISLTKEGEQLLPYLERASRALTELHQKATSLKYGNQRIIRIGSYPSIMKCYLSEIIKNFRKKNSDITIEVRIGGHNLYTLMADQLIDFAFMDENLENPNLWIPLFKEEYLVAIPSTSPFSSEQVITPQQLCKTTLILADVKKLTDYCQKHAISQTMYVQSTDDSSILSLVEQEMGVAVLSESSLAKHSDQIHIARLSPPIFHTVGIAYRENISIEAKQFIHFAQDLLKTCN